MTKSPPQGSRPKTICLMLTLMFHYSSNTGPTAIRTNNPLFEAAHHYGAFRLSKLPDNRQQVRVWDV